MKARLIVIASILLSGCVAGTPESGPPSQPAATAVPMSAAPADTDPTYTLECVQWPQSTCEESAHRLAERYAKTYPNLRVVGILVAGPCGSFQMRFDDGSGVGGDVDCIPPVPSD